MAPGLLSQGHEMGMLGRTVTVTLVALIIGSGLCLFDGDQPAGGDLCGSVLVAGAGPALDSLLAPIGWLPAPAALRYGLYLSDLPAPPPRV